MKKSPWYQKLEEIFGLDLRAMAFLRIAFGGLLLTDLVQRSFHLDRDYTDYGVMPREALLTYRSSTLSIHLITGSLEGQVLLFIVAGIFALGMLLGYRTRLCTIVSWFFLVSLTSRNFLLLYGGDAYLRMVVFWGIFLPWGQKFSIDSQKASGKSGNNTFSSLATFGFVLQVCMVYFFAGIFKSGHEWKDGTALYYVLNMEAITKPSGQFMLHYPMFLSTITTLVPYFEKCVPLLLVFPFFTPFMRTTGVILIVLFHTGILLLMELGIFSLICIAAAMGLLPKEFWDSLPFARQDTESKQCNVDDAGSFGVLGLVKYSFRIAFLTVSMIFIIFYNLSTLPDSQVKVSKLGNSFAKLLHFNQSWGMFAPGVSHYSGWYVFDGSLKNGQEVNALTGKPVNFDKPRFVYKSYYDLRDVKLVLHLREFSNRPYGDYYARFLCKDWNNSHQGKDQMEGVQAFYMKQTTLLNNLKTPPVGQRFIDYTCP